MLNVTDFGHVFNLTEKLLYTHANDTKATYIFKEKAITRAELKQKVERLADAFKSIGVTESNRVVLLMDDTPALPLVFLALIAVGAQPIPANPKSNPESVKHILEDSRACFAVLETRELESIFPVLQSSIYLADKNILVQDIYIEDSEIEKHAYQDIAQFCSLKELSEKYVNSNDFSYYMKKAESVAFWQYSSGTTGLPKAIQHTQQGMLSNTELFAKNTLGITENDVLYSIPKMFFGYGLGNSLFFPLYLGAAVVLDSDWPTPTKVINNLVVYKPTVLFGVPAIYHALLDDSNECFSEAIKKTRICFSAGANLPPSLFNRWKKKFNKEICDGIGATEVGHVFLCNNGKTVKPGKTGLPVFGYDIRLETEDGRNPALEERGVLHVRGPSVTPGYWEKSSLNAKKINNGWYRTGDVFTVDADGYYSYQGREDDLFKVNGRWVVPSELESKISENFSDIKEAVLVSRTNQSVLTEPVLFVSTYTNDENTISNIKAFVESTFEHYKHPADYFLLDEFPRNDNGKLMRSTLVDMANAQQY